VEGANGVGAADAKLGGRDEEVLCVGNKEHLWEAWLATAF
jgi:hypothetical protein